MEPLINVNIYGWYSKKNASYRYMGDKLVIIDRGHTILLDVFTWHVEVTASHFLVVPRIEGEKCDLSRLSDLFPRFITC